MYDDVMMSMIVILYNSPAGWEAIYMQCNYGSCNPVEIGTNVLCPISHPVRKPPEWPAK